MSRFWAGTVVAVASTAAFALGGCATWNTTGTLAGGPGTTYTPLVAGWEQFFRINWEPVQRQGRPYVSGYVMNDYGFPAIRVQLLVDGLDATGHVTSQSVSWLGSVPPISRVYFEVAAPQPAATYRVSVFAFDWLQTADIQTP